MKTEITKGKWQVRDEGSNGIYIKSEEHTSAIGKFFTNNEVIKNREEALANANYIVNAVNSHEELKAALVEAKRCLLNSTYDELCTPIKIIDRALKNCVPECPYKEGELIWAKTALGLEVLPCTGKIVDGDIEIWLWMDKRSDRKTTTKFHASTNGLTFPE
jgi:hypothetical protein